MALDISKKGFWIRADHLQKIDVWKDIQSGKSFMSFDVLFHGFLKFKLHQQLQEIYNSSIQT